MILFAGIRFFLAGLLVFLFLGLQKRKLRIDGPKSWATVLFIGFVQTTLQYVCFYIGLAQSPGSRGSILTATSTFFTIVLAALLVREEKLGPRKLLGCAAGFAGIVVISLDGNFAGATRMGDLLLVGSALSLSAGVVISKLLPPTTDAFSISALQLTFGGGLLLLLGLAGGGRLGAVTPGGILLMLYMAALSSVAFSLWTSLIRKYDTARVSIFFFLVPVFGVLLSGLFLQENIWRLPNLIALALVCAGILIINKPRKEDNNLA